MTPPPIQAWPGVAVLSGAALRTAAEAMLIAARHRRMSGLPQSQLYDNLIAALLQASATGQPDVPETPPTIELQPTVALHEAAARIGLSCRQVRRLAPKLGGKKIGGRWLLDHQAIEEHIQGMTWTETN